MKKRDNKKQGGRESATVGRHSRERQQEPPPMEDITRTEARATARPGARTEARPTARTETRETTRPTARTTSRTVTRAGNKSREQEPPPSQAMVDIVSGVCLLVGGG